MRCVVDGAWCLQRHPWCCRYLKTVCKTEHVTEVKCKNCEIAHEIAPQEGASVCVLPLYGGMGRGA